MNLLNLARAHARADHPQRRYAMLSDLQNLFSAKVQHAPALGFNRSAEAVYGPATTYPARVLYRARLMRDARGNNVVARGEAWIAGTPAVGIDDRIELPDGSTPEIIVAELVTDENGPSHAHVVFG